MAVFSTDLSQTVEVLLERKNYNSVKDILSTVNPADIAVIFRDQPAQRLLMLFRLLPKETAADVFVEMEPVLQEQLINAFSDKELADIVNEMYADDAADLVEEMPASSRKYPYIGFEMEREAGKDILQVTGLSKTVDGVKVLNNVSFTVGKGDKIAFVGANEIAVTTLFKILTEELEPDEGSFKWGGTITVSYFPNDNSAYFNGCELSILDWMRQYSKDETESYLRGFLGRMLFSGDDVFKPVKVLSGGEKVRCMFSRMMLFKSNVLILDRPTNHLDLESITAVNNGLSEFKGNLLFATHDLEILETAANRIIEITEDGCFDRSGTYEEYAEWRRENVGGTLTI